MKSLLDLVDNTKTDKNTVHSYLPLYQSLLSSKRDTARNVLEIGIYTGGSIKLWSEFFTNATVYGVDVRAESYIWDEIKNKENIRLLTETDAYDQNVVKTHFLEKNIKFDFILDDGPHSLESQRKCIQLYLPMLAEDGILIIEDVQSTDWIGVLKNEVPASLQNCIMVYDLRANKGRSDDIVFTVNRAMC